MTAIDNNPIMVRSLSLIKQFVLSVDMSTIPLLTTEEGYDNILANLDLLSDLVKDRVLPKQKLKVLVDEFKDLTMVLALQIRTPEEYVTVHNFLVARAMVALEKAVEYECYECAENFKIFLRDACGI